MTFAELIAIHLRSASEPERFAEMSNGDIRRLMRCASYIIEEQLKLCEKEKPEA